MNPPFDFNQLDDIIQIALSALAALCRIRKNVSNLLIEI